MVDKSYPQEFPEFELDTECPKCRNDKIGMYWVGSMTHANCTVGNEDKSGCFGPIEHMHRVCLTCKYSWAESLPYKSAVPIVRDKNGSERIDT